MRRGARLPIVLLSLAASASPALAAPLIGAEWLPTLRLTLGWVTFVALLGIGVLVFAGRALEGVLETLELDVSRAFWIGVATQVAAIPVLVVATVALIASIIGILAVPLLAAAWILALAGLITLGFFATARLIGHGLLGSGRAGVLVTPDGRPRRDALRALLVGLTVLIATWIAAALTASLPVVSVLVRGVALALAWVAMTAGMGAAVLSRGGRRRPSRMRPMPMAPSVDSWQTPTPVSGVVAARRPITRDPVETH